MRDYQGWHKSTRSGGGEDCVEQGIDKAAGAVGIRDTKMGNASPILEFSGDQWLTFVADIKANERLTGGVTA